MFFYKLKNNPDFYKILTDARQYFFYEHSPGVFRRKALEILVVDFCAYSGRTTSQTKACLKIDFLFKTVFGNNFFKFLDNGVRTFKMAGAAHANF